MACMPLCVHLGGCACLSSPSVCVASDADIGTYEARSMGHDDRLKGLLS